MILYFPYTDEVTFNWTISASHFTVADDVGIFESLAHTTDASKHVVLAGNPVFIKTALNIVIKLEITYNLLLHLVKISLCLV